MANKGHRPNERHGSDDSGMKRIFCKSLRDLCAVQKDVKLSCSSPQMPLSSKTDSNNNNADCVGKETTKNKQSSEYLDNNENISYRNEELWDCDEKELAMEDRCSLLNVNSNAVVLELDENANIPADTSNENKDQEHIEHKEASCVGEKEILPQKCEKDKPKSKKYSESRPKRKSASGERKMAERTKSGERKMAERRKVGERKTAGQTKSLERKTVERRKSSERKTEGQTNSRERKMVEDTKSGNIAEHAKAGETVEHTKTGKGGIAEQARLQALEETKSVQTQREERISHRQEDPPMDTQILIKPELFIGETANNSFVELRKTHEKFWKISDFQNKPLLQDQPSDLQHGNESSIVTPLHPRNKAKKQMRNRKGFGVQKKKLVSKNESEVSISDHNSKSGIDSISVSSTSSVSQRTDVRNVNQCRSLLDLNELPNSSSTEHSVTQFDGNQPSRKQKGFVSFCPPPRFLKKHCIGLESSNLPVTEDWSSELIDTSVVTERSINQGGVLGQNVSLPDSKVSKSGTDSCSHHGKMKRRGFGHPPDKTDCSVKNYILPSEETDIETSVKDFDLPVVHEIGSSDKECDLQVDDRTESSLKECDLPAEDGIGAPVDGITLEGECDWQVIDKVEPAVKNIDLPVVDRVESSVKNSDLPSVDWVASVVKDCDSSVVDWVASSVSESDWSSRSSHESALKTATNNHLKENVQENAENWDLETFDCLDRSTGNEREHSEVVLDSTDGSIQRREEAVSECLLSMKDGEDSQNGRTFEQSITASDRKKGSDKSKFLWERRLEILSSVSSSGGIHDSYRTNDANTDHLEGMKLEPEMMCENKFSNMTPDGGLHVSTHERNQSHLIHAGQSDLIHEEGQCALTHDRGQVDEETQTSIVEGMQTIETVSTQCDIVDNGATQEYVDYNAFSSQDLDETFEESESEALALVRNNMDDDKSIDNARDYVCKSMYDELIEERMMCLDEELNLRRKGMLNGKSKAVGESPLKKYLRIVQRYQEKGGKSSHSKLLQRYGRTSTDGHEELDVDQCKEDVNFEQNLLPIIADLERDLQTLEDMFKINKSEFRQKPASCNDNTVCPRSDRSMCMENIDNLQDVDKVRGKKCQGMNTDEANSQESDVLSTNNTISGSQSDTSSQNTLSGIATMSDDDANFECDDTQNDETMNEALEGRLSVVSEFQRGAMEEDSSESEKAGGRPKTRSYQRPRRHSQSKKPASQEDALDATTENTTMSTETCGEVMEPQLPIVETSDTSSIYRGDHGISGNLTTKREPPCSCSLDSVSYFLWRYCPCRQSELLGIWNTRNVEIALPKWDHSGPVDQTIATVEPSHWNPRSLNNEEFQSPIKGHDASVDGMNTALKVMAEEDSQTEPDDFDPWEVRTSHLKVTRRPQNASTAYIRETGESVKAQSPLHSIPGHKTYHPPRCFATSPYKSRLYPPVADFSSPPPGYGRGYACRTEMWQAKESPDSNINENGRFAWSDAVGPGSYLNVRSPVRPDFAIGRGMLHAHPSEFNKRAPSSLNRFMSPYSAKIVGNHTCSLLTDGQQEEKAEVTSSTQKGCEARKESLKTQVNQMHNSLDLLHLEDNMNNCFKEAFSEAMEQGSKGSVKNTNMVDSAHHKHRKRLASIQEQLSEEWKKSAKDYSVKVTEHRKKMEKFLPQEKVTSHKHADSAMLNDRKDSKISAHHGSTVIQFSSRQREEGDEDQIESPGKSPAYIPPHRRQRGTFYGSLQTRGRGILRDTPIAGTSHAQSVTPGSYVRSRTEKQVKVKQIAEGESDDSSDTSFSVISQDEEEVVVKDSTRSSSYCTPDMAFRPYWEGSYGPGYFPDYPGYVPQHIPYHYHYGMFPPWPDHNYYPRMYEHPPPLIPNVVEEQTFVIETAETKADEPEGTIGGVSISEDFPPGGSWRSKNKHVQKLTETDSDSQSSLLLDWKSSFRERSFSYGISYVDSHCHIDLLFTRLGYRGTWEEYRKANQDTFPANYEGCVAVFCSPGSFKKEGLWTSVAQEENVWLTFGCHPKNATEFTSKAEEGLRWCLKCEKVVALGEIGLDYSGIFKQYSAVQQMVFRKQLQIALELSKPLVIHCRDAEDDCLKILEEMVPKNYKIHCHCFTGSFQSAARWLNLFPNLYIGLTPLVSYKSASGTHEVARFISLERLLLETDSPYFVPRKIPKEDLQYSHPGMAITVAEEVARIKKISVQEVLYACRQNTYNMYGI